MRRKGAKTLYNTFFFLFFKVVCSRNKKWPTPASFLCVFVRTFYKKEKEAALVFVEELVRTTFNLLATSHTEM